MSKELQFLNDNKFGYLATVDENNMPRVRGWGIVSADENGIVFGTMNNKRVYSQLKTNPRAEYIVQTKGFKILRVNGEITFDDNRDAVLAIVEKVPAIKKMYGDAAETNFELVYMKNPEFEWFEMHM